MIRVCDGEDKYSQDEDGQPCRCGLGYDDVERRTIFPHERIGGEVVVIHLSDPVQAPVAIAQIVAQLRGALRWDNGRG